MIHSFYNEGIYIPDNKIIILDNLDNKTSIINKNDINNVVNNIHIIKHGASLLDILTQENYIKTDNDIILNHILTGNPHQDATRIIGSLSEVLVVKYCNLYNDVNNRLGMYARHGVKVQNLDNYIAVATGSMKTKDLYNQYYNPNDTQRDIVWVDKQNNSEQLLCISNNSSSSGAIAGLQVKASHNYQYVLDSIEMYKYPVLYFDLCNDLWKLENALRKKGIQHPRLIPHDDITLAIKSELSSYFNILIKIFNNEMTLEKLIIWCNDKYEIDLNNGIKCSDIKFSKDIILL